MNFYTLFQLKKDVDSNLHARGTSGLQDFYGTVDAISEKLDAKYTTKEEHKVVTDALDKIGPQTQANILDIVQIKTWGTVSELLSSCLTSLSRSIK